MPPCRALSRALSSSVLEETLQVNVSGTALGGAAYSLIELRRLGEPHQVAGRAGDDAGGRRGMPLGSLAPPPEASRMPVLLKSESPRTSAHDSTASTIEARGRDEGDCAHLGSKLSHLMTMPQQWCHVRSDPRGKTAQLSIGQPRGR
ncbi:hypothetical protein FOA52_005989 [Chlamydomonas sp. UWO 241]|nr:hypothetical protein FOA52_005989 [Chlamydomonas sp. UWO 241]